MSTPPQRVIDEGVLSDMNQAEKDELLLKLLSKEESSTQSVSEMQLDPYKWQKAYSKKRVSTDNEYREKKYKETAEYRRKRYHSDPEWREEQLRKNRERYKKKREEMRADVLENI